MSGKKNRYQFPPPLRRNRRNSIDFPDTSFSEVNEAESDNLPSTTEAALGFVQSFAYVPRHTYAPSSEHHTTVYDLQNEGVARTSDEDDDDADFPFNDDEIFKYSTLSNNTGNTDQFDEAPTYHDDDDANFPFNNDEIFKYSTSSNNDAPTHQPQFPFQDNGNNATLAHMDIPSTSTDNQNVISLIDDNTEDNQLQFAFEDDEIFENDNLMNNILLNNQANAQNQFELYYNDDDDIFETIMH